MLILLYHIPLNGTDYFIIMVYESLNIFVSFKYAKEKSNQNLKRRIGKLSSSGPGPGRVKVR